MQGEVPEHAAPGGGHAQAVVPSHPHAAARLNAAQQHHHLPPGHFQSHPAAQAQGPAPYSSEGAFVAPSSDISTVLRSPRFQMTPVFRF